MTQFAERFSDFEILSPMTTKLSWSHFCELIRVKTGVYYADVTPPPYIAQGI
jgi:hypothetical protein